MGSGCSRTPTDAAVINRPRSSPSDRSPWAAPTTSTARCAAKAAFETYSLTTKDERLALLDSIIAVYGSRMGELADIISQEVETPLWLAQAAQAAAGFGHLATARAVLADFEFERPMGTRSSFGSRSASAG
jgi:aldehyde dehydrogenase (NAD+)